MMISPVTSKYASAKAGMSIAFILLTAPFVHHPTPTHFPSWAGNWWYAGELSHTADKIQNLFKLCNIELNLAYVWWL